MEATVMDVRDWARSQFAAADLGDSRRTERSARSAAQVAEHPSGGLPRQAGSWNDLRAAYRLFDGERATFEAIAGPHRELTGQAPGDALLLIADATEIDYGFDSMAEGLSPVGTGNGRGFHLHSALMACPDDDRGHGLAGQLIYHRQPVEKGESRTRRLRRDDRESQIRCRLTERIGPPPSGTTWIQVADRGADDFEFLHRCREVGHDWVAPVKNKHRIISTPEGERRPLSAHLKTSPEAGCYTLKLRSRPGRPARTAKVVVSSGAIAMPTPRMKSPSLRRADPEPIPMRVAWAREVDAPPGVDPIDWVLYTSLRVEDLADAMIVVGYYEKRWLIEEWHKVLKTGLQVGRRQLKTSDRLEAMMGLMSVAAVRLFQLKGEARTSPERPAEEVMPARYATMSKSARRLGTAPTLTAGRFFRELAMLGGFLGREGDGQPGWMTIWRGWDQLQVMMRGADAYIDARQSES